MIEAGQEVCQPSVPQVRLPNIIDDCNILDSSNSVDSFNIKDSCEDICIVDMVSFMEFCLPSSYMVSNISNLEIVEQCVWCGL